MIKVGNEIERNGTSYKVMHVGKVARVISAKGIAAALTLVPADAADKTMFQAWLYDDGTTSSFWSI